MFGRIALPMETEELIVIPRSAVKNVGQLTLADVVEEGRLIRRTLQIGRTIDDDVEILAGLTPGELVAIPSEDTSSGKEGATE